MELLRNPLTYFREIESQLDSLLKNAGVVTIGVVLGGIFNYGFQLFVGRALGPEAYATFGALFALTYLIQIVGRGIRFSASRYGAQFTQRNQSVATLQTALAIRTTTLGIGLTVAVLLFAQEVAEMLGTGSTFPVVLIALSIPFSFLQPVNIGLMEGTGDFKSLAWFQVLPAVVRLVIGAGLILLGLKLSGAILGIVLSVGVAAVWSGIRVRRTSSVLPTQSIIPLDKAYRYFMPALFAGVCFNVPGNVDVIIVQDLATGVTAGYYTAASVLGKSMMFLVIGLTSALFPAVSSLETDPETTTVEMRSLFKRGMLYSATLLGGVALVYLLIPQTVLGVLYGPSYLGAVELVQWYTVATYAFCLSLVVLNFELARSRYMFVALFALVSLGEVIVMLLFGGNPVFLIQVLFVANITVLVIGLFKVMLELSREELLEKRTVNKDNTK